VPASAEIARKAFGEWISGAGYVAGIFTPGMTWERSGHDLEIVGRSAVSANYSSAAEFSAVYWSHSRSASATTIRSAR
jgi:hypothetical protein